tara:strand:+ start:1470 stop:1832 length:363 start_codon:yes stop_codon:yes gene_type:complete
MRGAIQSLKKNKIKNYKKITTPGIFEIPVAISKNITMYDAFIVLGCVIKGKTNHFELITKTTTDAIMNLSIKYKKPIANGIISCFNKKQANERSSLDKKNKGKEATEAALHMLRIFKNVR